jgi:hypothetical protein
MSAVKISLAGVLSLLAALGFGFFCFVSQNYLLLGNTISALTYSILMMVAVYGLAFVARKTKIASSNFRTFIMVERFVLILYIGISVLFIQPFSQFFNVYEKREGIQKKVLSNIGQADGMFEEYETYANNRIKMYKDRLIDIVDNYNKRIDTKKYNECGFVQGQEPGQVLNKVNILKAKLYPTNYKEIKQTDSIWLVVSKESIQKWRPIAVVDVVKNLDKNINSRNDELKSFMKFQAGCEDSVSVTPYNLHFSFSNVKGAFQTKEKPNLIAIVVAVGLYFLILLDYFVAQRHFRNGEKILVFKFNNSKREEDFFK